MKPLTLREKVGQLMVFGFNGPTTAEASREIIDLIKNDHVGGIILFGRNIGTPLEIVTLTTELQKIAKEAHHEQPLFICIDQENGVVRRLGDGTTVFPGAMLLGATDEPQNAYEMGMATGKELKALGINWNLAPVVDVNNNPNNPVIGVRSYGENAEKVAEFSEAAMKGMQAAGVMTCLKHFPGHGDTNLDSHLELPTIGHDMKRLEEVELVPFRKCIQTGADTVMSAHVYFPALENRIGVPATMSKAVITGLLREKLGYKGVITTDCMEMKAISDTVGTARGAVEAIKAGIDLVMISHLPSLQKEAIEAIVTAVETGEILESQIDEAVERVRKLKSTYLSWEDINLQQNNFNVPAVVGCIDHQLKAKEVFRQGVTIVKKEKNILPLSNDNDHKVLVVYPKNSYLTLVEDERYSSHALGTVIEEVHPAAEKMMVSDEVTAEEVEKVLHKAKSFDTVIVGTLSASQSKGQQRLVDSLSALNIPIVVVAMRSPYDLSYLPNVPVYIVTYEFTTPALKMAARSIYGLEHVTGKLPITI